LLGLKKVERDRFGVEGLQKLLAFGEELVEDRDG
jgi:hypothetical protein